MKNLRNFSWVFGGLFKKLLGQNQTKVSYKKYWVYYEFFGKYRINKLRANRVQLDQFVGFCHRNQQFLRGN